MCAKRRIDNIIKYVIADKKRLLIKQKCISVLHKCNYIQPFNMFYSSNNNNNTAV